MTSLKILMRTVTSDMQAVIGSCDLAVMGLESGAESVQVTKLITYLSKIRCCFLFDTLHHS